MIREKQNLEISNRLKALNSISVLKRNFRFIYIRLARISSKSIDLMRKMSLRRCECENRTDLLYFPKSRIDRFKTCIKS